jgi:hypothetical protein
VLIRYGYQSNTRIKFVIILALADAVVRDADVKTVTSLSLSLTRTTADHNGGWNLSYSELFITPTSIIFRILLQEQKQITQES